MVTTHAWGRHPYRLGRTSVTRHVIFDASFTFSPASLRLAFACFVDGAAEAVDRGDEEGVAGTGVVEHCSEAWAGGVGRSGEVCR